MRGADTCVATGVAVFRCVGDGVRCAGDGDGLAGAVVVVLLAAGGLLDGL